MSDTNEHEHSSPTRQRWQFSLRQMFAATTGIAIVFGLAAWGGWIKSDAVVYLSIAVLAGVFFQAARWALVGACAIIGEFWLALLIGHIIFGRGQGLLPATPEAVWIFFGLITASPVFLRMYANASALSLLVSLVLVEIFMGAVVVYSFGYSTLFQAFASENRAYVFQHFCEGFGPIVVHLLIALPWLAGIVLGTIFARWRKSGSNRGQPA